MEKQAETGKDDHIDVLDYINILLKYKKPIISITVFATIISIIYALMLPFLFKASATILLPKKQSMSAPQGLSEVRGLAKMLGGGGGSMNDDPITFMLLAQSREFTDKLIDKFDLMEEYDVESKDEARELFPGKVKMEFFSPNKKSKNSLFGPSVTRIVIVSAVSKSPEKAAEIANTYVKELQDFLNDIALTGASQKRLFLEKHLTQVKSDLTRSEEELKKFKENTGLIIIDAQSTALIEGIATLRAQIVQKEVELEVMKTYSTTSNPDLQRLTETLKSLRAQIASIKTKDANNADPLTMDGIPSMGIDYMRKLRDFKFNEGFYELVTQQYELAKLEESADAFIIQVIDNAIPPERNFYPKRRRIVIRTTFIAFVCSIFLVFLWEFIETTLRRTGNEQRINTLKKFWTFLGAKQ